MREDLDRARAQWMHRGQGRPDWAVEPGPGQESVWDYPRPPRLDPESRPIRVQHGSTVIAETERAIRVLETASPPTIYIPRQDVRTELLIRARGATICEWKGSATYWSLEDDDGVTPKVAWGYEEPFMEFEEIRGYLSFYPDKLRCTIDGERVRPQLGGFYGGWVTANIVGPFKGETGTGGW